TRRLTQKNNTQTQSVVCLSCLGLKWAVRLCHVAWVLFPARVRLSTRWSRYFGHRHSDTGVRFFLRMYHGEKIMDTNLLFLIVDAKDTCTSCDSKWLIQAEQPSLGPDPCELAQNPRYRKGPDVCFDNDINEDASDCGAGSCLSPSLWPMFALQLVLLWVLAGPGHYPS
ncbi:hypothetical protein AAFF_G00076670, partial [Aldrovandia affinis]